MGRKGITPLALYRILRVAPGGAKLRPGFFAAVNPKTKTEKTKTGHATQVVYSKNPQ